MFVMIKGIRCTNRGMHFRTDVSCQSISNCDQMTWNVGLWLHTHDNQYKHTHKHTHTPTHTFQTQTCLHNRSTRRSVVVFHCVFHCWSVVVFHMSIDSIICAPKTAHHTNHTQTYITRNVLQHIVSMKTIWTFTRYTNNVTTRVQNT